MHDVFFSFSFADQEKVEYIANSLSTKHGITYWVCSRDVLGGQYYKRMIAQAIDDASVVVLVQSASAVESREIPKEISIAFEAEKTVIPFKLDHSAFKGDLRYDLAGVEFVDATRPTMDERIAELARSINEALGRHTQENIENEKPVLRSSNISYSEIFYGRKAELESIDAAFAERNAVFLRGMGGIGKSEIARQYARRHNDFYKTVVFARYEDDLAALIADDGVFAVNGAARKTKADNTPQSDAEYALDKIETMKRRCDAHTLIIIDNYDVTGDPFMDILVRDAEYRVLVTTRCAQERGKYHMISVGEIDDRDLIDMVIDYANPETTMIDPEDIAFPELLALTSRHTLALELIAKFMDEKCIDDIGEMVALLKQSHLAVLSESDNRDGFSVIRNLFRLTKLSDVEKSFLRYLAILPPEGVPQKLFRQWTGDVFKVRSRMVGLSLVKINNASCLSIHPIIRDTVISELRPDYDSCRDFIDGIAMVHEDYVPLMWKMKYDEKKQYLDCYGSILKIVPVVDEITYPLYLSISTMYNYIGSYEDAIALLEKMYAFACSRFGENSNEAMLVLNNIGWKNANYNYDERALPYYRRVANYYIDHPDYESRSAHSSIQNYARGLIKYYQICRDPECLVQAKAYFEKFEAYGETMMKLAAERNDPSIHYIQYQSYCVSRSYCGLYIEMGKYDLANEALMRYYDVLQMFKDKPGISYEVDMCSWNTYRGQLKYLRGEYGEAINALIKAYEGYLEHFSMSNLNIINVLIWLVSCLIEEKRFEEAEKYLAQALEIAEGIYAEGHPTLVKLDGLKERIR